MERDLLLAAGFEVRTYPDQDGEFLRKDLQLQHLPDAVQEAAKMKIMDGDDKSVVVEICPDRTIQLFVPALDYHENCALESTEGRELLRRALLAN